MTHAKKEKLQFCGLPCGEGVEQEPEGLEIQEILCFSDLRFKISESVGHTRDSWPCLR